MASEARSDLTIDFCMDNYPIVQTFSCESCCFVPSFELLRKIKKKKEEEEENLWLLDLRLESRR